MLDPCGQLGVPAIHCGLQGSTVNPEPDTFGRSSERPTRAVAIQLRHGRGEAWRCIDTAPKRNDYDNAADNGPSTSPDSRSSSVGNIVELPGG